MILCRPWLFFATYIASMPYNWHQLGMPKKYTLAMVISIPISTLIGQQVFKFPRLKTLNFPYFGNTKNSTFTWYEVFLNGSTKKKNLFLTNVYKILTKSTYFVTGPWLKGFGNCALF